MSIVFLFIVSLSHVGLFVTPWTVAHQAPMSMKFSRQKYCTQTQLKKKKKRIGGKEQNFKGERK